MMIEGDLTMGGVALAAGDCPRMPSGSRFPTGSSLTGCVAFFRMEGRKAPR
jgi:hypothetical protein